MNEKNRKYGVVTKILKANDRVADENRRFFADNNIYAVNIMSKCY